MPPGWKAGWSGGRLFGIGATATCTSYRAVLERTGEVIGEVVLVARVGYLTTLTQALAASVLRERWSEASLAELAGGVGPDGRALPHLRSQLPTLWSRSYFVASVGAVSAATVQRYIETQDERVPKAKPVGGAAGA